MTDNTNPSGEVSARPNVDDGDDPITATAPSAIQPGIGVHPTSHDSALISTRLSNPSDMQGKRKREEILPSVNPPNKKRLPTLYMGRNEQVPTETRDIIPLKLPLEGSNLNGKYTNEFMDAVTNGTLKVKAEPVVSPPTGIRKIFDLPVLNNRRYYISKSLLLECKSSVPVPQRGWGLSFLSRPTNDRIY